MPNNYLACGLLYKIARYVIEFFVCTCYLAQTKKAGTNVPTNLLTLGERANTVSVRLAGLEMNTGLSTKLLHSQSC